MRTEKSDESEQTILKNKQARMQEVSWAIPSFLWERFVNEAALPSGKGLF